MFFALDKIDVISIMNDLYSAYNIPCSDIVKAFGQQ